MRIIADTHVHLYPTCETGDALRVLARNLGELDSEAIRVGFIVDREACSGFASVRDYAGDDISILPADDGLSVRADMRDGPSIHIVAGCQVATSERIEVLGLGCAPGIPDGVPAAEAVNRIRDAAGVPVLARALGKWMFGRRHVMLELLDAFGPTQVAIGDSTLCTDLTGEGRLTSLARERGYCFLAGSDPLPTSGDETAMGTYASCWETDEIPASPAVADLLPPCRQTIVTQGRRNSAFQIALRVLRRKLH